MLYGKIVEYFPSKRFGFIRPDYGPDVFFHITALGACQGEPRIKLGQPVKYELVPGTERTSRRRHFDQRDAKAADAPAHPQARLIELIDKIPGAVLDDTTLPVPRHPRARRKKPNWRR